MSVTSSHSMRLHPRYLLMFANRAQAGDMLAEECSGLELRNPIVLGIPRGGVVTADALARGLNAELGVLLAHKLRAPGCPEVAIGAVAENGSVYLNDYGAHIASESPSYLAVEKETQKADLRRREEAFRAGRSRPELSGRSVIVTDDGVATGATLFAALRCVRAEQPDELIAAVPVAPPSTIKSLREECDRVICLATPSDFRAVGQYYQEFNAVSDEQVMQILRASQ